ncbi:MAG: FHA domain-containing protein [bacterium]|nr:FHA domain-containing protein [bacterium]
MDDAEDISGDDEDSGSEVVDSEEVSGDDFEDGDTSALAQAPDLELEEDSDHNYETQDRSGELIGKKSTVVTPQPRLIEIVEEGEGRAHVLRIPITTVGRLNLNHICVPDGTVSRNHAKIVVSEAEITVFDLASENGVFVNKNQITEHILVSGDIVQFGAADQLFEFRVD